MKYEEIFLIYHGKIFVQISVEHDNMIPGSKGHTVHACMKKYDIGDCGSTKCVAIRGYHGIKKVILLMLA